MVQMCRLGDIAQVITGNTPSKQVDAYWNNGHIPFITPGELGYEVSLVSEPESYITQKGLTKARLLPKNAVLVCCIGSLGKLGIAPTELVTNQQINALIFDERRVYYRYGAYALTQTNPIMQKLASSTTVQIINKSSFSNIEIPVPPITVQRDIADILDKAQELIDKRKQQIEMLDEFLQSVFLDMFGDPVINPFSWRTDRLGDYITFMTSGSRGWAKHYSADGDLFLRIGNVKDGKLLLDDKQFVKAPQTREAVRAKVQEHDLLISITADLGRTAVVDKETALFGAYINQHLCLVRVDQRKILPGYLSAFLESAGGRIQFERLDQVGVKSGLNFDAIKSLEILSPPLSLQEEYLNKVSLVKRQQLQLQKSLSEMQNLFSSIMQRAFKGELFS